MISRRLAMALGAATVLGRVGPAKGQEAKAPARPQTDSNSDTPGAPAPKGLFKNDAPARADEKPKADEKPRAPRVETATFGGGCFWCTEAVFERIPGVKNVVSGYSGGLVPNPTYQMVGSGQTGHAEVVQIEFDPDRVSYEALLKVFWTTHDPTTLNAQGPDFGTQYRSIILYHSDDQKKAAQKV
jgi:peptide-methionine (S)-S-oxide reductase